VNSTIARMVYYLAQEWRGEPVAAVLRELERSVGWSAEQLRALQWGRLRDIVQRTYETVPFYRETWRRLDFSPEDLRSWADWGRLPAIGKSEVQQHATAMMAANPPRGLKAATSGSSGTPVAVERDHRSWAHAHANVFRAWRWWGVDCGQRYAYFWGVPLDDENRRIAAKKDRFFNRTRCSAFTLNSENARVFYESLRREPARFAFGYPSALTQFADEVTSLGLDGRALGWKVAITSGEMLRDAQRERIANAFGCPVVNGYGCAEIGVAGFEHPEGGMRVPVESVVVDYERTSDGAWSVLLTDLHNLRMPMLRYRVGDLVEPAGDPSAPDFWPLPEGSRCALPVLGTLTGRAGETLVLPDGRRLNANQPSYIFKSHGRDGRVREYQFVQFPTGRIELRIVAGPAWNDTWIEKLRGEVKQVLGIDVELRVVPGFERLGRGKHRDFVRAEDVGEA